MYTFITILHPPSPIHPRHHRISALRLHTGGMGGGREFEREVSTRVDIDANALVSVLQCVAVCCGVLQCVAVCCSVLQCKGIDAKARVSVLPCVAV